MRCWGRDEHTPLRTHWAPLWWSPRRLGEFESHYPRRLICPDAHSEAVRWSYNGFRWSKRKTVWSWDSCCHCHEQPNRCHRCNPTPCQVLRARELWIMYTMQRGNRLDGWHARENEAGKCWLCRDWHAWRALLLDWRSHNLCAWRCCSLASARLNQIIQTWDRGPYW